MHNVNRLAPAPPPVINAWSENKLLCNTDVAKGSNINTNRDKSIDSFAEPEAPYNKNVIEMTNCGVTLNKQICIDTFEKSSINSQNTNCDDKMLIAVDEKLKVNRQNFLKPSNTLSKYQADAKPFYHTGINQNTCTINSNFMPEFLPLTATSLPFIESPLTTASAIMTNALPSPVFIPSMGSSFFHHSSATTAPQPSKQQQQQQQSASLQHTLPLPQPLTPPHPSAHMVPIPTPVIIYKLPPNIHQYHQFQQYPHTLGTYSEQLTISPIAISDKNKQHKTKKENIKRQLMYYFSTENLCKDVYLRSLFNKYDGKLEVAKLMSFNRLKILTQNGRYGNLLVEAAHELPFLELLENDRYIRLTTWERWILI